MNELKPIEPEYIYVTIPAEYVCVYHRILAMMADYGEDMLKDCKASCTDKNSGVIECFNMFNAAVAARKLEKDKLAEVIIKYIKAKINQIYKGADNSTSFVFPVDENGQIKAFVSCGERPRFAINADDGELYEHKLHNGFDEHFRLGPEDEVEQEPESVTIETSKTTSPVEVKGLSLIVTPRYEKTQDGIRPCADIIVSYNGEEINVNDTDYQYYFDEQPVLRFNDVSNLSTGVHNFKVIVTYKGETKIKSIDKFYSKYSNNVKINNIDKPDDDNNNIEINAMSLKIPYILNKNTICRRSFKVDTAEPGQLYYTNLIKYYNKDGLVVDKVKEIIDKLINTFKKYNLDIICEIKIFGSYNYDEYSLKTIEELYKILNKYKYTTLQIKCSDKVYYTKNRDGDIVIYKTNPPYGEFKKTCEFPKAISVDILTNMLNKWCDDASPKKKAYPYLIRIRRHNKKKLIRNRGEENYNVVGTRSFASRVVKNWIPLNKGLYKNSNDYGNFIGLEKIIQIGIRPISINGYKYYYLNTKTNNYILLDNVNK